MNDVQRERRSADGNGYDGHRAGSRALGRRQHAVSPSYDWDHGRLPGVLQGQTGIYLPLAGKDVTFARADNCLDLSNFGEIHGMESTPSALSPDTAVTDENGEATRDRHQHREGPADRRSHASTGSTTRTT